MAFYCFIIFQRLTTRGALKLNPAFEAVYIGTLIYLVYGFFRRELASRWVAVCFHVAFQVMETVSVFVCFDPKMMDLLLKQLPPGTGLPVLRVALIAVYGLVTWINIASIVYLWKNPWYFQPHDKEQEETA
jgi:hypothetical protein